MSPAASCGLCPLGAARSTVLTQVSLAGVDWNLDTSHEQCAYEPTGLSGINVLALRFLILQRKPQLAETVYVLPDHSTDVLD